MLTRDRPEMAARAVRCFREQTYSLKRLLIYDTGELRPEADLCDLIGVDADEQEIEIAESNARNHHGEYKSIGYLRNRAAAYIEENAELIIHWDDDDWSHPNRIAEQVALLQSSGAECVGYRELLFWETRFARLAPGESLRQEWPPRMVPDDETGRSWLYTNNDPRYCLGTSLCYWRKTWERRPFPDLPKAKGGTGEDTEWLREVKSVGVTAFSIPATHNMANYSEHRAAESMLIATIHGGNSQHYDPAGFVAQGSSNWRRVSEWDQRVREIMERP